jgi:lantibiotic modifying enzyme
MTTHAETLWPRDSAVTTDPCSIQHGAAGVLGVLSRAAQVLGDRQLYDAVARAAAWIGERRYDVPRFLPGLYFGRAGTAWSMYDAGRLTGDREATRRALDLAARVPVSWPNPDVCHGSAGAGLTYLHLWRATGDPEMERRAVRIADDLVRTAREADGGLLWSTPADFDSAFAGDEYYGFAHGAAGIGAFLLYAAVATGRDKYLETAARAGTTLERAEMVDGDGAWWPARAGNGADAPRLLHWCSGSAGVGTFLIRLWSTTGEPRFRALAEAAGAAVYRDQWYSGTSTCHGVPGHGEFLLDLADFTGDQRYHDWAGELAATIHTTHAVRGGLTLIPDESGADFTVGYHSGMSGVLGFLLRLRHGGSRWWMPDEILPAGST